MSAVRLSSVGQRRIMLLATVGVAVFVLFFPARHLVQQRDHIDSVESRLEAVRAENQRLSEDAARLSDPSEVEVLARERLGLVRPGERAYFIEPSGEPAADAPPEEKAPPVWSRAWTWLRSLVRGRG